jgi:hypothetical protein
MQTVRMGYLGVVGHGWIIVFWLPGVNSFFI